jgi:hypothetical protein
VIALAGSGSGAVQRELQRLVDSKLVASTATVRQKRYRANPDAPIATWLAASIRSAELHTCGAAWRAVALAVAERRSPPS